MTFIAKLFIMISIIYMIKAFLYPFYKPVSKKNKKKARSYIKETNVMNKKEQHIKQKKQIMKKYGRYILSESSRLQLKKMIDRLDMGITPEEIRFNQYLYSIVAIIISIIIHKINPILGYISTIFIILAWLYPVDELEKKIEKKNKNILQEFPSFYSMVYYQYSKSVNIFLADVIRDYIPNANEDMADELAVMLDNVEYGEEYALKRLKKRVPLHYIIKFCDIMETRLKGYDNTSQMLYLKNEIDEFRIVALEEELKKREQLSARTQLVLIFVLAIYIVIYYFFTVLESIKIFT